MKAPNFYRTLVLLIYEKLLCLYFLFVEIEKIYHVIRNKIIPYIKLVTVDQICVCVYSVSHRLFFEYFKLQHKCTKNFSQLFVRIRYNFDTFEKIY